MSFKIGIGILSVTLLAGCTPPKSKMADAYWQRVEAQSALYLTGPKAQQQLEENIATCVREVDELVELGALRETTPPDTRSAYHNALEASGDLDYFETPTRYKDMMVAHSDFHDFESCMRSKGWERVKYVRYQQEISAKKTRNILGNIRKYGTAVSKKIDNDEEDKKGNFDTLNQ